MIARVFGLEGLTLLANAFKDRLWLGDSSIKNKLYSDGIGLCIKLCTIKAVTGTTKHEM